MNQDKILKIIKGLNRFSIDDIVVMTGLEENKTEKILTEFIRQEKIIKVGNEYRYLKKVKSQKVTLELIEKPAKKIINNNNLTFNEAAQYFLAKYALQNCSTSTFKTYTSITKVHLIPFFGKLNLKDITQIEIKEKRH